MLVTEDDSGGPPAQKLPKSLTKGRGNVLGSWAPSLSTVYFLSPQIQHQTSWDPWFKLYTGFITFLNHFRLQNAETDEAIISFPGPELSAQITAADC